VIAVDTNVLLRFLVQDDARQGAIATLFLENELTTGKPGFVTIVAILELDWVLRSEYGFSNGVVAGTIRSLMATPNLVVEHSAAVEAALAFQHGDLADNIQHQTALANGCSKTVTFDKKFARIEGVERLA
jgi:predicted nucleic-acid-binding protein